MAGLLDSFFGNGFDDPKSNAVMALANGLMNKDFRGGINGYMQTMAAAPEANYQKAMQKAKLDELNAQAGLKQEQIRQSIAKDENEKRIRELIAGAGRGNMVNQSLLGDSLPANMTAGSTPQLQDIDYTSLMQQGVPFDVLKDLAATRNLGREEVARVQDIEGQNGAKILQGFDRYGRPVGQGVNGYLAPQLVNQGNKQTFVKPSAGVSLPISQSPDNAATVGASYANAAATRSVAASNVEAARIKRDQDTEMKLSDDYRNQSKDFKAVGDAYNQINTTLDSATKSPAATLAAATKFMKLLDPGSVVRESELGMALAASGVFDRATNYVNTLQNGKTLTPNQAKDFKNITEQIYNAAQISQKAIDKDYIGKANAYKLRPEMIVQDLGQNNAPKKPITPMKGMVMNGYKFKGGDPANQANWEKQ